MNPYNKTPAPSQGLPRELAGFPYVIAEYRKELVPELAGNPYVEALPALPDDVELGRALKRLPRFNPAERELPSAVRIQLLDGLQELVVPLPRLIRLARAVIKMLRTGYKRRRPFTAEDNQILRQLYLQQQSGDFVSAAQNGRAAQHSMALIGSSGSGKSFSLRQIAGLFPQVIYHEELGKWQLPYIFVEMPYDGESLHTLASEIFAELDRLLPDANYTVKFGEGLNAQRRLALALKLAYEHGVGMIFVDEAQNQKVIGNEPKKRTRRDAAKSNPKSETPLIKLLITQSNVSNMPLCMSGTLEMQTLVGGTRFSRSRRMSGRGSAEWLPLESSGLLERPGEFELMLASVWPYCWLQKPSKLTNDWVRVFFELTQGIPDIIVKLYESSQEAAIANRTEQLTEALVRTVFKKEFFVSEFGIVALRDKNRLMLDVVPDLYLPDSVESFLEDAAETSSPVADAVDAATAALQKAAQRQAKAAKAPKAGKTPPAPVAVSVELAAAADLRETITDTAAEDRLNHVTSGA
jgi:energy-coupling factor transporter ATP-binding protein EcfA2